MLIIWAHWVMPRGVMKLLASWLGKFNRYRTTVIWSMIPYCLMWGIWRERKACTFNNYRTKVFFSTNIIEFQLLVSL